ncbi:MAG: hypothetical protein Q8O33_02150 [Pseudomonadota bacterium]|nr:hypothetical protein [Pseudomonadota bacterium]
MARLYLSATRRDLDDECVAVKALLRQRSAEHLPEHLERLLSARMTSLSVA